jgi:hypothetical protein
VCVCVCVCVGGGGAGNPLSHKDGSQNLTENQF